MLVGESHGIGKGPLLSRSGDTGPDGESERILGLGQQVPHRGGGSWRYPDASECPGAVYGDPCRPAELFGLGEFPGGYGNLWTAITGAALVGSSFFLKGEIKDIARILGIVFAGIGTAAIIAAATK